MGYLHEGHLSLIRLAREHADVVVTSIYVNPAQFGPAEDFARYPRDLDGDVHRATSAGADILFAPVDEEMYPPGFQTHVQVEGLSELLEGRSRSGHFRGVVTVVAKLFHITRPHVVVFGQKDAQQVVVVRKMVNDLNFDVEILVGPTVREKDGLAMSSRNVYLTAEQRKEAPILYRSLCLAEDCLKGGAKDAGAVRSEMMRLITSQSSGIVDYASVSDYETLQELERIDPHRTILVSLAVRFGSTRLIDNCVVALEGRSETLLGDGAPTFSAL